MEKWLLGFVALTLILLWLNRRLKLWLHKGNIVRPEDQVCQHHLQTPKRWSQDGWVSRCHLCRDIVYHGDDYDAGS